MNEPEADPKGIAKNPFLRFFLGLVAFSLAGSTLSRATHLDPGPIAPVTSLLTIGVGVVAAFHEYARVAARPWLRGVATLALGAGAEIGGLATGFPFGRYAYTTAWWPTIRLPVGPFPLALPFAWLLMAGTSAFAAQTLLKTNAWCSAILGGLIAAGVDLVMEPVMTGPLGYWRWIGRGPLPGHAPVANFCGWWGVGTFAGLILVVGEPLMRSPAPRWVLGGFVVLILGLGLIGSVL